ncbi:MAG: hypothetical protein L0I62_01315 [Gammaproteobacteria bacterium]|nr:hypothetical protein [Gammaproteobacteria bacterium]
MASMIKLAVSFGLVAMLCAGCYPASDANDEAYGGSVDTAAVDTAIVATATQTPYGSYLVDAAGISLYLFKADSRGGKSTCYDRCAEVWPPLLSDGEPEAGGQAKAGLLGTIERRNGSTQVTYNGWPLYYYAPDDEAGDTKGQDVHGFGAEWYLVTPAGSVVHAE